MKRKHHELVVWQEAVELVSDVYRLTRKFPKDEQYGLTSQIRRAAVSVASNIAEGSARATQKEFLQFLHIARGSLSEVETQLIIARNLGYLKEQEITNSRMGKIFAMLGGLINSIKHKSKKM